MATGSFRIAEEIPADRLPFGSVRNICQPSTTGAKQLAVVDAIFNPGQCHSFHMHPDQEEVIYMVAGTIEQWIGREKRVIGAGDAVFIPAGLVHASFNVGGTDARLIAIFGPCIEDGFTTVDVFTEAPWKDLRA